MTTISSYRDLFELHRQDLADYYKAMLSDHVSDHRAEQERFNRDDLLDIANGPWDDLTDAERGLIALLCNTLL